MLTTDGYLGVALKINLVDHAPMTICEITNIYKRFEYLFALPEETIFQFLLISPVPSTGKIDKITPENDNFELNILKSVENLRISSHNISKSCEKHGYILLKFKILDNFFDYLKNPFPVFK